MLLNSFLFGWADLRRRWPQGDQQRQQVRTGELEARNHAQAEEIAALKREARAREAELLTAQRAAARPAVAAPAVAAASTAALQAMQKQPDMMREERLRGILYREWQLCQAQGRIAKLQADNAALRQTLDQLQEARDDGAVAGLQADVANARTENEHLQKQLADKLHEFDELAAQAEELAQQADEAEEGAAKRLAEAQAEREALERELTELRGLKDGATAGEVAELARELTELRGLKGGATADEMAALERELAELRGLKGGATADEVAAMEAQVAGLTDRVTHTQADAEDLEEQLAAAAARAAAAEAALQQLRAEYDGHREKAAAVDRDALAQRERAARLEGELAGLRSGGGSVGGELAALREEMAELKRTAARNGKDGRDGRDGKDASAEELERLKSQLTALAAASGVSRAAGDAERYRPLGGAQPTDIMRLNDNLAALQAAGLAKDAELAEARRREGATQSVLADLRGQLGDAKDALRDATGALRELQDRAGSLERRNVGLEKENAGLQREGERLRGRVQQLEDENQRLRSRVQELEDENRRLRSEIARLLGISAADVTADSLATQPSFAERMAATTRLLRAENERSRPVSKDPPDFTSSTPTRMVHRGPPLAAGTVVDERQYGQGVGGTTSSRMGSQSQSQRGLNGSAGTGGEYPRRFIALYDYIPDTQARHGSAPEEVELGLREGDLVLVYSEQRPDGFYLAEVRGERGLVPASFLEEMRSADHAPRSRLLGQLGSTSKNRSLRPDGGLTNPGLYHPGQTKQMRARYDFDPTLTPSTGRAGVQLLPFRRGDVFAVNYSQQRDDGLVMAQADDGSFGLVPVDFLDPHVVNGAVGGRQSHTLVNTRSLVQPRPMSAASLRNQQRGEIDGGAVAGRPLSHESDRSLSQDNVSLSYAASLGASASPAPPNNTGVFSNVW